jgi:hypothetical protein
MFVLVPVGLFLWEVIRTPHEGEAEGRMGSWPARLAVLAAGPLALGAWFAYLRTVYGEWPFQQQPLLINPLTAPPLGYLDTLRRAAGQHATSGDTAQLGGAALPLLIVVGAALLFGIVRAWRLTSPVDPVFLLLTVLMFSLTWAQLLFPKDMMRIAAIPLVLLPAAIAGARRAPEAAGDRALMRI